MHASSFGFRELLIVIAELPVISWFSGHVILSSFALSRTLVTVLRAHPQLAAIPLLLIP
jgi:hypothetical protein